jgi:hypothetical protein
MQCQSHTSFVTPHTSHVRLYGTDLSFGLHSPFERPHTQPRPCGVQRSICGHDLRGTRWRWRTQSREKYPNLDEVDVGALRLQLTAPGAR